MKYKRFLIGLFIFLTCSFIFGLLIYKIPFLFRFFYQEIMAFGIHFISLFFILVGFILYGYSKKHNKKTTLSIFLILFAFLLSFSLVISDNLIDLKGIKAEECHVVFISEKNSYSEFGSCYMDKAIEEVNEGYCWSIRRKPLFFPFTFSSSTLIGEHMSPTSYRDMCLTEIAEIKKDSEICKFVTNRKNCLSKLQTS